MFLKEMPTRFLTIFTLSFVLAACSEPPPPSEPVVRPIKMLDITAPGAGKILEYPGEVAAGKESELSFEVTGRLIELLVDEGNEVTEGQLLAKLDPRDFESSVLAAQSEYDATSANFKRAESMLADEYISQADYDSLKAKFTAATANLEKAQKAKDDTELRAPYSGVIARRFVDNFTNITAKQNIVLLHDKDSLDIDIGIPENDLSLGGRGATRESRTAELAPRVTVTSFPDKTFPAQVKSLATTADPTTRTFTATLSFVPSDDVLVLPGMTAKVSIQVPVSDQTLLIPASAVSATSEGNPSVWLVDDSMKVSRADVTVGALQGEQIEILEGLEYGQTIATSGVHHLREGLQVSRYQQP